MSAILASTGCIVGRVNGRDHRLIMKYRPLLHCDGMEFMMYESWYPIWRQVAEDLKASGIAFPAMHVEKTIGDRFSRDEGADTEEALKNFELNCRVAQIIGAKELVLHLWGGMASDRHIEHNIAMYAPLRRMAEDMGLFLTVENVLVSGQDPMTHMLSLLQAYPDAAFTIDTKMAAFHDQLNLFSEPEYAYLWTDGHIRHLHINDYGGGYKDFGNLRTLYIGDGHVDFKPFFDTAARYGYKGTITCECTAMQPDGSVNIDRLNESLDKVRAMASVIQE